MMLDSFRRMSQGVYGPYEISMRIMEFLALMLIAYEVFGSVRCQIKERKRKKIIDERVAAMRDAMRDAMSRGQELQNSPPQMGDARVASWAKAVDEWTEHTRILVKSYSPHTEIAFLQESPSPVNQYGSIGAMGRW